MKGTFKVGTVAIFAIMAGCASLTEISPIAPAGKDTFFLASKSWDFDFPTVKSKVYQEADAYCRSISRSFMPTNESAKPYGRLVNFELTFRCLFEDDPEFRRPNMKLTPNIRIESQ